MCECVGRCVFTCLPLVLPFASVWNICSCCGFCWWPADPWPQDESLPVGRWLCCWRCVVCYQAEQTAVFKELLCLFTSSLPISVRIIHLHFYLHVHLSLKRLGAIEEPECWLLTTNTFTVWLLCEMKSIHLPIAWEDFQGTVWICGSEEFPRLSEIQSEVELRGFACWMPNQHSQLSAEISEQWQQIYPLSQYACVFQAAWWARCASLPGVQRSNLPWISSRGRSSSKEIEIKAPSDPSGHSAPRRRLRWKRRSSLKMTFLSLLQLLISLIDFSLPAEVRGLQTQN